MTDARFFNMPVQVIRFENVGGCDSLKPLRLYSEKR
jgi:hypothetical protein